MRRLSPWIAVVCACGTFAGCGGGGGGGGGSPPVSVPNVVGDTQAAASSAIDAAGLVVGTVTQQASSTVAAGDVISESPVAGTSVADMSAVSLIVSSGPSMVTVPSVTGDTQAAATTSITGAGLVVGSVTAGSSPTVPLGEVISESPAAGTSVAPGSAVNLVISSTYVVSVSVTGLVAGQSVTVENNGSDSLTFSSSSKQSFATALAANASYSVTVTVQPILGNCTVAAGSGTGTGPVTVAVACALVPVSTTYPAFSAPYPLVVAGQSPAVVIAHPTIIPVFFSDIPAPSGLISYLQSMVTSKEWAALGEYGVGTATVGTAISLTSAAPATTTTSAINAYVAANAASWGTLNGSEVFVLYYPDTTTITDYTDSYHSDATTSGNQNVAYAVIQHYGAVTPVPATEAYAQFHEIAEASTDPIIPTGYYYLNHDTSAWSAIAGGNELADMCTQFTSYIDPTLVDTGMLGIWSNAAVTTGNAPCTTAGSVGLGAAFGAYPVLPSTYVVSAAPGDTDASVSIAPGASVTVPIQVFSYGPMTELISIAVSQANTNVAKTNALTFSLDQSVALNGSVVHLTITAPATPLSSTTNYAVFNVIATIPPIVVSYTPPVGANPQSAFPGVVTN